MKEILLPSHIVWENNFLKDVCENFYPSTYKKFIKKEQFLKDNFEVEIVDVTEENINLFIYLYLSEVASKPDYNLKINEVLEKIRNKKEDKEYKFLFIFFEKELIFGELFYIRENNLGLTYKAYKKEFNNNFEKKKLQISVWADKIIFEYGKEKKLNLFSIGKDSHPRINENIGLNLFKIRNGSKPRISKTTFEMKNFSIEEQKQKNNSFMFFTNPDKNDFFQDAYLYYPKGSLEESYVDQFRKAFEWAKINLNIVEY